MNVFKSLNYLNKNSEESKEAKRITDKLRSNDIIANEILKSLENEKTRVVLDSDIKNSYYVFFKDTIYISNREKNNGFHRCILVAHECVHSIQSKIIQVINFVLSNIELVAFITCLIFSIIFRNNDITYIYLGILLLSIIPRLYLELHAVFNSIKVANKYIREKLDEKEATLLNNIYKNQISFLFPFSIIPLFSKKILRGVIIFAINYFL